MFAFFDMIGGFITTIVNFVVNMFQFLVNLMKLIFKAQVFLVEVVQSLPPFMVTFFLIFVALAILFQILNKGS